MFSMYVSNVCFQCMFPMYVSNVCFQCMFPMYVSNIHRANRSYHVDLFETNIIYGNIICFESKYFKINTRVEKRFSKFMSHSEIRSQTSIT